jgi:hypothetical protein
MLITFSTGTPGLAPGYTILEADKTEYAARTETGITDLGGGEYGVEVANATLAGRVVLWDTGETVPRYATEMFAFTSEALDVAAILALVTTTSAGRGAIAWPYTLTMNGGAPIADAAVWVRTYDPDTGLSGDDVICSGRTNNFGQLIPVPQLDAGTYGFWAKKAGTDFPDNPDVETVVAP